MPVEETMAVRVTLSPTGGALCELIRLVVVAAPEAPETVTEAPPTSELVMSVTVRFCAPAVAKETP